MRPKEIPAFRLGFMGASLKRLCHELRDTETHGDDTSGDMRPGSPPGRLFTLFRFDSIPASVFRRSFNCSVAIGRKSRVEATVRSLLHRGTWQKFTSCLVSCTEKKKRASVVIFCWSKWVHHVQCKKYGGKFALCENQVKITGNRKKKSFISYKSEHCATLICQVNRSIDLQ